MLDLVGDGPRGECLDGSTFLELSEVFFRAILVQTSDSRRRLTNDNWVVGYHVVFGSNAL